MIVYLRKFEEEYPSYYELKHNNEVASIDDAANRIGDDQVLIEYVLTDSLLFCFAVGKDEIHFQ